MLLCVRVALRYSTVLNRGCLVRARGKNIVWYGMVVRVLVAYVEYGGLGFMYVWVGGRWRRRECRCWNYIMMYNEWYCAE